MAGKQKQSDSVLGIAVLGLLLAAIFAVYFLLVGAHRNFPEGEFIPIDGNWEYTFRDDVQNVRGPNGGDGTVWKEFTLKPGDRFPGSSVNIGRIWIYRRVRLPEHFLKHSPGLILGRIQFCDEVYVNGVLVGKTGSLDLIHQKGRSGWNSYRHYEIPPQILKDGENEIALRIGYSIYSPVIMDPIGFATAEALDSSRIFWNFILDYMFLAFSFAFYVIGLTFFIPYWKRRKEVVFLYYSLLCFFYGTYLGMFYASHVFGAGQESYRLFYTLPPWCAWCFFNLIAEMFKIPKRGFRLFFGILLSASVVINLALPSKFLLLASMFTHTSGLAIFVLCLSLSIGAARRNVPNAIYAAFGISLLVLSSVFDNFAYYFIPSTVYTFPITTIYIISIIGVWFSVRVIHTMNEIEDLNVNLEIRVEERTEELRIEKVKTDDLIRNILPDEIVEELKRSGKIEPRRFERATMMFADIVGFTAISEHTDPALIVGWLDGIFRKFDDIAERYKLEKLKTIGDCYMTVCGVPVEREEHALFTVRAAFEMLEIVQNFQPFSEWENEKPFFRIRIGIHSGAVVAGVIGTKKYSYDIWGDNVNIASRLESAGQPGRINISADAAELIKAHYKCVPRGLIEIRNRAPVEMFWVEK
jgi:class 3 adenylate cyclase